jgi:signal-transduction protein with cAMP-binding, CBS, and nucleotidyltransferase domain
MIKCEFIDSDMILNEGDQRESLYIIKEGQVSCIKNGIEIKRLTSKDYFGEISILFQTKRTLSISSVGSSICFQITQSVLIDILGENFRDVLLKGLCKEAFNTSKFMKHMIMDGYFDQIFNLFKITLSKIPQVIISSNHFEKRKIVIVVQGTLIKVSISYLERYERNYRE